MTEWSFAMNNDTLLGLMNITLKTVAVASCDNTSQSWKVKGRNLTCASHNIAFKMALKMPDMQFIQ